MAVQVAIREAFEKCQKLHIDAMMVETSLKSLRLRKLLGQSTFAYWVLL